MEYKSIEDIYAQLDHWKKRDLKRRKIRANSDKDCGTDNHKKMELRDMNAMLSDINREVYYQRTKIDIAFREIQSLEIAKKYWKGLIDAKVKERLSS